MAIDHSSMTVAMQLGNAELLSRDKPTSCIQFSRLGDLVEFADPCPQAKHTDLFFTSDNGRWGTVS